MFPEMLRVELNGYRQMVWKVVLEAGRGHFVQTAGCETCLPHEDGVSPHSATICLATPKVQNNIHPVDSSTKNERVCTSFLRCWLLTQ